MDKLSALRHDTGAVWCVECGKCTATCPLAALGPFSARGLASHDFSQAGDNGATGVGHCLTCASCEERCPQGVHFTEYVRGVRELMGPEALEPCPHGGVFDSAARLMSGDQPPTRGTQWLEGEDLEIAEEGELALFVGCLPLFDQLFKEPLGLETVEIARSAIRLLNHLGITPVVIEQERCCGHDSFWRGDQETFTALAKANAAAFAERGVKHIVTTCAECCRTWLLDYPEFVPEYRPRVEHLTEFLAQRLESGELTLQSDEQTKLTYHDPCRLGRHLGVYDAPRKVIDAVPEATFADMTRSGRDAVCCGTSGFIHCDAASRALQMQRIQSAADTGADKMLTTCPKCLIHFTCVQAENQRTGGQAPAIEVQDLSVFAASLLPDAELAAQARNSKHSVTVSSRSDREGGNTR